MSVLLLNASYQPLRVITTRRAMGLILAGKAELITEGDGEIRSTSASFPMPVVVRLRYMVKVPFGARVPLNRRTLTVRDNGECQVGGCPRVGTTIDHLQPRSRGGRHEWVNVTLMCTHHNRIKSNKLMSELGWKLKTTPRPPRDHMLVMVAAKTTPKEAWMPYLVPTSAPREAWKPYPVSTAA